MSSMKWRGFMVVSVIDRTPLNQSMWKPGLRLCVNKPHLSAQEIAVAIEIEIPTAYFTPPKLSAKISLPDPSNMSDAVDAVCAIEDAIVKTTGISVQFIRQRDPEKDDHEQS